MKIDLLDVSFNLAIPPQRIDKQLLLHISTSEDINKVRDAFTNTQELDALSCEGMPYVGFKFDHISVASNATVVSLSVMTEDERFTYLNNKINSVKDIYDSAITEISAMLTELYEMIVNLPVNDAPTPTDPVEEESKDIPEESIEEPKEETPVEEESKDIPEESIEEPKEETTVEEESKDIPEETTVTEEDPVEVVEPVEEPVTPEETTDIPEESTEEPVEESVTPEETTDIPEQTPTETTEEPVEEVVEPEVKEENNG